jgi:hypothetical protein
MIERINPFQHGAFGHYSQGVKIDLGPKTTVLVVGQIALNDDGLSKIGSRSLEISCSNYPQQTK